MAGKRRGSGTGNQEEVAVSEGGGEEGRDKKVESSHRGYYGESLRACIITPTRIITS